MRTARPILLPFLLFACLNACATAPRSARVLQPGETLAQLGIGLYWGPDGNALPLVSVAIARGLDDGNEWGVGLQGQGLSTWWSKQLSGYPGAQAVKVEAGLPGYLSAAYRASRGDDFASQSRIELELGQVFYSTSMHLRPYRDDKTFAAFRLAGASLQGERRWSTLGGSLTRMIPWRSSDPFNVYTLGLGYEGLQK